MAVTSLNLLPTFLFVYNFHISNIPTLLTTLIFKYKNNKKFGNKFRLVTAMHRNGPLPQVMKNEQKLVPAELIQPILTLVIVTGL